MMKFRIPISVISQDENSVTVNRFFYLDFDFPYTKSTFIRIRTPKLRLHLSRAILQVIQIDIVDVFYPWICR